MAKTPRMDPELQSKSKLQLMMLTKRCDDYHEEGAYFEAYSVATIVRVLVHDTGNSASLLKQLGIKDTTRFMDSRSTGNLYMMGIMNGFGGLHPRTRMPHRAYRDTDLHDFDEWWEGQEFHVVGNVFNRKQLITTIANQEGGAHVDPNVDRRIAAINRTASPYSLIDGDKTMPMYGAELASVCAIGEEILFSLTPEPENRKRMLWEPLQKPFYLTMDESDAAKEVLGGDLTKLEALESGQNALESAMINAARNLLETTLEIDCLTSEDFEARAGVARLMDMAKLPWDYKA